MENDSQSFEIVFSSQQLQNGGKDPLFYRDQGNQSYPLSRKANSEGDKRFITVRESCICVTKQAILRSVPSS